MYFTVKRFPIKYRYNFVVKNDMFCAFQDGVIEYYKHVHFQKKKKKQKQKQKKNKQKHMLFYICLYV